MNLRVYLARPLMALALGPVEHLAFPGRGWVMLIVDRFYLFEHTHRLTLPTISHAVYLFLSFLLSFSLTR